MEWALAGIKLREGEGEGEGENGCSQSSEERFKTVV